MSDTHRDQALALHSEVIGQGFYGVWTPGPIEQAILEQIFPTGV